MKPGDLRETAARTVGECYCCRRLYNLDDLLPVRSPNPDDWRYICPLCRTVAQRGRLIGSARYWAGQRMAEAAEDSVIK